MRPEVPDEVTYDGEIYHRVWGAGAFRTAQGIITDQLRAGKRVVLMDTALQITPYIEGINGYDYEKPVHVFRTGRYVDNLDVTRGLHNSVKK